MKFLKNILKVIAENCKILEILLNFDSVQARKPTVKAVSDFLSVSLRQYAPFFDY
jgi:hypothetical protein